MEILSNDQFKLQVDKHFEPALSLSSEYTNVLVEFSLLGQMCKSLDIIEKVMSKVGKNV